MTRLLARCLLGLAAALAAAGPLPTAFAGGDAPAAGTSDAALRLRIAAGPRTSDAPAARAWALALAAEGRARRGSLLGGDCLAAAAAALAGPGADAPGALLLWRECAGTYPPEAPEIGLAWYERGVLEARTNDAATALASLETAARLAAAPVPAGADADAQRRHARLRETMDGLGRSWRADLLERLGRHAEAADLHEALALARGSGRGPGADLHWERAALAAWRAKDRARALDDVARAIEAATDDERIVRLEQWRLLASHGRLDERGDPRLSRAPADDASLARFLADARATLDRVRARRGLPAFALQIASALYAAKRPRDAVEFYAAAFGDPSFAPGPAMDAMDRLRLVTGAAVALAAGEPERARDWCLLAERGADAAVPGAGPLRLRIDEALSARDEPPGEKARDEPAQAPRAPPAPVAREGLRVPADPDPPAGTGADLDAAPPPSPSAARTLEAAALLTVLLAGLAWYACRRARRG